MNDSLVILTPQFRKLKRRSGVSSNCLRKLEQKALGSSKRFTAEPSVRPIEVFGLGFKSELHTPPHPLVLEWRLVLS